jgi:alpha-amylase
MKTVVPFFEAHQPFRLRRYSFLDQGSDLGYFDEQLDRDVLLRVAERCYRPVTALFKRLADRHGDRFAVSLSITGTLLDQLEAWSPETLHAFRELIWTDRAELLAETSHHSLTYRADPDEFRAQVDGHRARLEGVFGRWPTIFRNTELISDEHLFWLLDGLGFDGLICEGAPQLLGDRSPTRVYTVGEREALRVLPRQFELSDDVAFRFSNRGWSEWPLTADRWAHWVRSLPEGDAVIGLYMDLETFGEHQHAESGIFEFFEHAVDDLVRGGDVRFAMPSVALAEAAPAGRLHFPHPVSWADAGRDLGAWLANPMQQAAFDAVFRLGPRVRAVEARAPELARDWRRLTTSDHFYYMSVADGPDGEVHGYFRPYPSPHDAHIAFMNVLADLKLRLERAEGGSPQS